MVYGDRNRWELCNTKTVTFYVLIKCAFVGKERIYNIQAVYYIVFFSDSPFLGA
jgi:hypothetical protein